MQRRNNGKGSYVRIHIYDKMETKGIFITCIIHSEFNTTPQHSLFLLLIMSSVISGKYCNFIGLQECDLSINRILCEL